MLPELFGSSRLDHPNPLINCDEHGLCPRQVFRTSRHFK